jgi:hypothetical protein
MIFEHFATELGSSNWVHKTRICPLKHSTTLAPKLADLLYLQSGSIPFYIQIEYSLKLDPATLIWIYINMSVKWKGINRKQSTRWQHLSRLKASAFFSLQKILSCYETQLLILGTGTAIWWVTEPHWNKLVKIQVPYSQHAIFFVTYESAQ